ncbi:MAG: ATP synthase subunit I [Deltaproteobacteria bacterium]|nr:ATP synthase subunit I [Deltaproteobacteria bacterium]MDD9873040.1 ATP synthase subunit I [Deltaproteobacteria bacterium]
MKGRLRMAAVQRLHLFLAAGVALLALFGGGGFALAVLLGAALQALNFRALYRFSTRIVLRAGGAAPAVALLGFALRLALLGVAIVLSLRAGANPLGLLLGLSLLAPAMVAAAWRARPAPMASQPGESAP